MHPLFEQQLEQNPELHKIIVDCIAANDFSEFSDYLKELEKEDPLLDTGLSDESGVRYYKPFHLAAFDKVYDAYLLAIENESLPIFKLSFQEIDEYRKLLRFKSYGSPQDVLYGFTSERYKKWGPSLTKLFFQSGCMAGVGEMYVTTAPRYLTIEEPDIKIDEIQGAIPNDFWETQDVLHTNFIDQINQSLVPYEDETDQSIYVKSPLKVRAEKTLEYYLKILAQSDLDPITRTKVVCAIRILQDYLDPDLKSVSPFKIDKAHNQEQIAMKYSDEGRFIQKILGGRKVEHVQSNVKMVVNPLRGNKCEIDSIYRVLGDKEVVLVEAKGSNKVSVGQLYQIYETFLMRLPQDWKIRLLAVLLSTSNDDDIQTSVDVVEVSFDKDQFGDIAESLFSIHKVNHYRWDIRKPI